MINYTIDTLMSRLGCAKFPERWRDIYSDAVSILEKDENPLLHPEYYDELHEKYQVFESTLEYYKKAAEGISKNEELSLFFCLLCRALRDRATIQRDIAEMEIPTAPEGEGTTEQPEQKGCKSVAGVLIPVIAMAAVVVIKKKKDE